MADQNQPTYTAQIKGQTNTKKILFLAAKRMLIQHCGAQRLKAIE